MTNCICHFEVRPVQRSAGRSVTAAIAYRDGEKIKDERTGETFDYSCKKGIEHTQNIIPANIKHNYTTSELWNAAEKSEKRINSIVGREYIVALPCELTQEERKKLAADFAASIVERYGVAANVAVHLPGQSGDERNYHAHIMTSTRVLTPEGFGEKTRILDTKQTSAAEIAAIRQTWADMSNAALTEAGSERQMDARSFRDRGLEREPEIHLGPLATAIERRHDRWEEAVANGREAGQEPPTSERGDRNRDIRALNSLIAERAAARAVLKAMERKRQKEKAAADRREADIKKAAGEDRAAIAERQQKTPEQRLSELREREEKIAASLKLEADRLAAPGVKELKRRAVIELKTLSDDKAGVDALLGKLAGEYDKLKNPDLLDRLPIIGGLLNMAGWNNIENNAEWERRYEAATVRDSKIQKDMAGLEEKLKADIKAERLRAVKETAKRSPDMMKEWNVVRSEISGLEHVIQRDMKIAEIDRRLEKYAHAYSPGSAGFAGLAESAVEVLKLESQRSGADNAEAMRLHPAAVSMLEAMAAYKERSRGRGGGMSR